MGSVWQRRIFIGTCEGFEFDKVEKVEKVDKVQTGWLVRCGRVFKTHEIQHEKWETQRHLNGSQ